MFARKILLYINLALVGLLATMLIQTLLPGQDGAAPLTPKSASGNLTPTDISSPHVSAETISIPQPSAHKISESLFTQAAHSAAGPFAPGQNQMTNHLFKHLVLTMTVAGSDSDARAVIKNTKTNSTQLYKTNDLIDSARIAKITRGQVLLQHNQNQYTLKLARNNNSAYAAVSPKNLPRKSAPVRKKITTPSASKYLTPLENGIELILSSATIKPFLVDGNPQGLQLTNIENIPAAKRVGLKNNDVIHVINDQLITSKQKGFQVLKKIKSQSTIRLEIIRNHRVIPITFEKY